MPQESPSYHCNPDLFELIYIENKCTQKAGEENKWGQHL